MGRGVVDECDIFCHTCVVTFSHRLSGNPTAGLETIPYPVSDPEAGRGGKIGTFGCFWSRTGNLLWLPRRHGRNSRFQRVLRKAHEFTQGPGLKNRKGVRTPCFRKRRSIRGEFGNVMRRQDSASAGPLNVGAALDLFPGQVYDEKPVLPHPTWIFRRKQALE